MCFIESMHKLLLILLTCYNCFDTPDYKSNDYCSHELARNPLGCYWNTSETLRNIVEEEPPKDTSIFFLDTSCDSHHFGRIIVKKRLACAVESAARLHPNRLVYILYTSPGTLKFDGGQYGDIVEALLSYKNIRILYVNFINYLQGTPVETLTNGILRTPVKIPGFLPSDVLRWVTLWKYGGVYLDDDVIVIKPLDDLPKNFVGTENIQSLADGILGFSYDGVGHDYVTRCLQYLNKNFSMVSYKRNGLAAITRLTRELCGMDNVSAVHDHTCNQLNIFRPHYFYPVPVDRWTDYYRADQMESVMKRCQDSYTLHLWNYPSGSHRFSKNRNGPYVQYARKYCPQVSEKANKYF